MRMMCLGLAIVVTTFAASAQIEANGLVVLLTDYGEDESQIAALKGAVYTQFPNARIESIGHTVEGGIAGAAYLLMELCDEFPEGTVFCCDVGTAGQTDVQCVAVQTTDGRFLVGPDNGVLSIAARQFGVEAVRVASDPSLFRRARVSHTMHGRDIFGPVAGALADGVELPRIGPSIEALRDVDFGKATAEDGVIRGRVIQADGYGNLITNIVPENLFAIGLNFGSRVAITIGDATFEAPIVDTYGDVPAGERLVMVQSMGLIQCAINMGNLSEAIKEGVLAEVRMKKAE